ncbi:MAG TPA: endolytic transglycosylase MltG [Clostridiaceae bacterium]|nr:endolytic transglycosylase MltG [Clostridiaceae bacterium]
MSTTKSGSAGERSKGKKKNKALIRLTIFLVLILLTLICASISYRYVLENQRSGNEASINIPPEEGIKITIPHGSSTSDIAEILKKEGIIKNVTAFKILSKINGYDGTYNSGTHVIAKGVDYDNISGYETLMQIFSSMPLSEPDVTVRFVEGSTLIDIENKLAENKLIDRQKFRDLINNGEFDYPFLKDLPKRENRLEGYLFPDTYRFSPKGGEKAIITKMLNQFNNVFEDLYYKRAEQLGMTVDEIIILASIIEKEAAVEGERETISGVFHNRLKSKDKNLRKLQSCATLNYIFTQKGQKPKEVITVEDEQIDHPYNTYMYEGLPPGPICSPGRASIIAALSPEDHNYYYFVEKGDGSGEHYFSKTYEEHLKAKAKAEANRKARE